MKFALLLIAGLSRFCDAFAPPTRTLLTPGALGSSSVASSTSLKDLGSIGDFLFGPAPVLSPESEEGRQAFFIWFFGASGAAGIARSAFPRMFKQVVYVQGLAGVGPTKGGETLGISPLCGYPEDLAVSDIQQILKNPLSVEKMVEKYPVEDNMFARKGYLTFEAFEKANAGANPLALRAIFDTFAQSTDLCAPDIAQGKLDAYKADITEINGALFYAKFVGYFAIVTLLFLLGLADIVASIHAYHGWFPDWPGGKNFPLCLFDLQTGPWTIPKYWI